MIRHVSIPAEHPAHVAEVLAELMQGRAFPFPGPVPGAFMAVSGDAKGTMVEVYPHHSMSRPGAGDQPGQFIRNDNPPDYWPFHLLLGVPVDEATIQRLGEREGWRTRRFGRGAPGQPPVFYVIEMWIENRLLIELATEEMVGDYERASQIASLEAVFGARANAEA
jgi:hypothetical protein